MECALGQRCTFLVEALEGEGGGPLAIKKYISLKKKQPLCLEARGSLRYALEGARVVANQADCTSVIASRGRSRASDLRER